ncbi:MAG: aminopeptidase, partial [Nanoarchaeota archaeon]
GNTSSKDNVMIVGKGITFDSGGLDIKTASGMETMKMDMAGAGAVLGVMSTIAELKLKRNVIGVIPTCENLISPKSYKPGDIITAYNKTTVEVLNTDAEGRLILGDAIAYGIDKYKPKLLIDLATLTGACLVVFGEYVSALVSNDDDLSERLFSAGQRTFERVWRLPLYDEYKEMIKSDIADIKNIGHKSGYAGTLTGAAFINRFVNKTKWAHLDIAGTAWSEGEQDYISKGGTGYGVRLLTEFLELIES